ncbi:unnamed protein product [Vitrella brassicaformis CCMP3155]|uniref:RING-type E3 ubiquitin transferase n=2 Tax=Vitrella brassicaformis TaxID=1169539 RepID=A0A0G4ER19_VITBC|nr:unnamed protein product [Vitrella brassicaformis CCMP3155]|eukprot:CEL99705.1 unnamed protein product [Vitrella brassicaformis CCMP3155]
MPSPDESSDIICFTDTLRRLTMPKEEYCSHDHLHAFRCEICYDYAIGRVLVGCRHVMCWLCALRLRVKQGQTVCPVCREDQPTAIGVDVNDHRTFDELKGRLRGIRPVGGVRGIYFLSPSLQSLAEDLLSYKCWYPQCLAKNKVFESMQGLSRHLSDVHQRSPCLVCVQGQPSLFLIEQPLYTKKALDEHMSRYEEGEARGTDGRPPIPPHPTCRFCREAFYSAEELQQHMRENHEHCPFCPSQPTQWFRDYASLFRHFETAHYVCRDPVCLESRHVAFRTQAELQIHRAEVHGDGRKKKIRLDVPLNYVSYRDEVQMGARSGYLGDLGQQRGGRGGGGRGRGGRGRRERAQPDMISMSPDGPLSPANDRPSSSSAAPPAPAQPPSAPSQPSVLPPHLTPSVTPPSQQEVSLKEVVERLDGKLDLPEVLPKDDYNEANRRFREEMQAFLGQAAFQTFLGHAKAFQRSLPDDHQAADTFVRQATELFLVDVSKGVDLLTSLVTLLPNRGKRERLAASLKSLLDEQTRARTEEARNGVGPAPPSESDGSPTDRPRDDRSDSRPSPSPAAAAADDDDDHMATRERRERARRECGEIAALIKSADQEAYTFPSALRIVVMWLADRQRSTYRENHSLYYDTDADTQQQQQQEGGDGDGGGGEGRAWPGLPERRRQQKKKKGAAAAAAAASVRAAPSRDAPRPSDEVVATVRSKAQQGRKADCASLTRLSGDLAGLLPTQALERCESLAAQFFMSRQKEKDSTGSGPSTAHTGDPLTDWVERCVSVLTDMRFLGDDPLADSDALPPFRSLARLCVGLDVLFEYLTAAHQQYLATTDSAAFPELPSGQSAPPSSSLWSQSNRPRNAPAAGSRAEFPSLPVTQSSTQRGEHAAADGDVGGEDGGGRQGSVMESCGLGGLGLAGRVMDAKQGKKGKGGKKMVIKWG